jgi:peroxiredoxin Q/BCP
MRIPAALLLVLAACNSPSASPPPLAASTTPSAAPMPSAPAAAASSATAMAPDAPDPLVGQVAPDFTTKAQDGSTVHLSALKGKNVIVYFYPKDETPGCTKEACSFRDAWANLAKTGAVLIGVSADSLDSHKAFVDHWKLPFLLVSDPDGSIGKLYNVPFQSYHQRQTVEIGPDGKVKKVYRKVDVTVHAQQVTDDLSKAT